ncbi:MAG: hypothetical protein SPL83_06495 [Succinivibrio sp.]|nr:hypothetical protein [Succinivibrio sp.]
MGICDEFKSSQQYMLATEPFNLESGKKIELVKLTHENVAKVEAMIRNDSSYKKSYDENAGPTENKKGKEVYSGSTAFWMTQLKCILEGNVCDYTYEYIIKKVVCSIDRENSTHLNSDGCGIEEISKRLINDLGKDKLIDSLKNGDLKVFNEIQRETHPDKNGDKKYKARKNTSFASKFCHFACFFLFEDDELRDKYSIYDNVIASVLKYYIKKYEVVYDGNVEKLKEDYLKEDYSVYREVIDLIRKKAASITNTPPISRNGFDHLLWYYHKGR